MKKIGLVKFQFQVYSDEIICQLELYGLELQQQFTLRYIAGSIVIVNTSNCYSFYLGQMFACIFNRSMVCLIIYGDTAIIIWN